jgi:hypothetical protein
MRRSIRCASSALVLLLLLALGALNACGGGKARANSSTSAKHAPFESVAYHRRCPQRDLRPEASPDARTASVLVPRHPTGALLCRFWGLDDRPHRVGTIAGSLSVSRLDALDRLAARLDALPRFPTSPSPSCPAAFGRVELFLFHYRHTSDDPVYVEPSGCIPVSNGRLVKIGIGRLQLGQSHWPDEALL